jgi:hypothetical protein
MVSVRLPPDLTDRVNREASRLGMSLSEFVRRAALGTLPPPPPFTAPSWATATSNTDYTVTYDPPSASSALNYHPLVSWEAL